MITPEPHRGFDENEYRSRTHRIQIAMAEHSLDGLLFFSEAEVRYFSGFHTPFWQSPTRPWFLFIPLEGNPVAIIPQIGAPLMSKTWIIDIRSWSAPSPADDGVH